MNEFAWKCHPKNNFILGQNGSIKIYLANGKAIKSMKRTICQFRVTLKETIMIYLRITNCKDEHYLKVNNTETSGPIGEEILIPTPSLLTLDKEGLYSYYINYLHETKLRTDIDPRKQHCNVLSDSEVINIESDDSDDHVSISDLRYASRDQLNVDKSLSGI